LLSFVFCFVSSFLFLFLFFLLVVPLGPPIDTQKCVQFFCPISKNVPARLGVWKKKGVRTSVAPHRNQPDFFLHRLDRTLLSRANACAACQIRPRTATLDNMSCIAAHVNNRVLEREIKSIDLNIT
jgi:hypothetical protein